MGRRKVRSHRNLIVFRSIGIVDTGLGFERVRMEFQGARILPGFLDETAQTALVNDLRVIAVQAPFSRFTTPSGRKMSVRMTSAGRCGWIADRSGYRYSGTQPDGTSWPDIPERVLSVWNKVTGLDRQPDCCLLNYYDKDARMGLHQDKDEGDLSWPVVSISLGDDALFRIGATERKGPTKSIWLQSGDIAVLEGPSRLAFHGVDRTRAGTSRLLKDGGRLNLTLRVVSTHA